jgi:hypothetical protein
VDVTEDQIEALAELAGATLRKRTGLYGRPKMRVDKPAEEAVKRGGYLRRRRY